MPGIGGGGGFEAVVQRTLTDSHGSTAEGEMHGLIGSWLKSRKRIVVVAQAALFGLLAMAALAAFAEKTYASAHVMRKHPVEKEPRSLRLCLNGRSCESKHSFGSCDGSSGAAACMVVREQGQDHL